MPDPNPAPATDQAPVDGEQQAAPAEPGTQPAVEPAAHPAPADGQPSDGKPAGDNKPAEPKPVEYGEFTAAEGVTLDQDALGEFKALAGEAKLSQEQAQKVVDLGVKMQQKWAADQSKAMQAARDQWAQASNTDKEFGGEKLAENLSVAKTALDKFGSPELKQLLNDSGLGNHPEIIRFFYRAGKAISNDRIVSGGNGPGAAIDPASVLFPSMK